MLRSLGQGMFGLFSLVNSTIGYLTVLDLGFGNTLIRYLSKSIAEKDEEGTSKLQGTFLLLYLGIGTFALCLGLLIPRFADFLFVNGLTPGEIASFKTMFFIASVNLSISFPLNVFTSIIVSRERFIFQKTVSLVRILINPVIYVLILSNGYKAVALITAIAAMNVLFGAFSVCFVLFRLKARFSFKKIDVSLFREIVGYSFWVFLGVIVNQLWWNSGQLMLGIFATTSSIAIFALAMQLRAYFEVFATAISGVFLPKLTMMETANVAKEEFSRLFIRVGRLQFYILLLILSGFALVGKSFIIYWAGPEYIKSYYVALGVFVPLLFIDSQTLGIVILQSKNKHAFRSITYLVVAITSIVLSVPLIRVYDVYGCAVAIIASLVTGNLFIMNLYYRRIGLDVITFWKSLLSIVPKAAIPFVLGILSLRFVAIESLVNVVGFILVYTAVFFAVMYSLSFDDFERNLVTAGFHNRFSGKRKG